MERWIKVKERLPQCDRRPNRFGEQVLIWPPHQSEGAADTHVAFFGTRVSDEPCFYIHGRAIEVSHWMPLPGAPKEHV